MKPQIELIAKSMDSFPTYIEKQDFTNGIAFEACITAVQKYDNLTAARMNLKTFAYWQLVRTINNETDKTSDMIWVGTSLLGEKIILTNQQYRKMRKKLETKGYKFASEKATVSFEALYNGNYGDDEDEDEDEDENKDDAMKKEKKRRL